LLPSFPTYNSWRIVIGRKNASQNLVQIGQVQFGVALLVGLVLGQSLALPKAFGLLVSQGVLADITNCSPGRLSSMPRADCHRIWVRRDQWTDFLVPAPQTGAHRMVCLYLGETVFCAILALGVWSQGVADPPLLLTIHWRPLRACVVGLILGEGILASSMWLIEHFSLVRRLQVLLARFRSRSRRRSGCLWLHSLNLSSEQKNKISRREFSFACWVA